MAGTVLIVDDEVQLVRHLEHLLRSEAYQVVGVHSAAEARRAAKSLYPDVVLLDLRLPDGDGTTLMGELMSLLACRRLDMSSLITHTFPLSEAMAAYDLFENKKNECIKVALKP